MASFAFETCYPWLFESRQQTPQQTESNRFWFLCFTKLCRQRLYAEYQAPPSITPVFSKPKRNPRPDRQKNLSVIAIGVAALLLQVNFTCGHGGGYGGGGLTGGFGGDGGGSNGLTGGFGGGGGGGRVPTERLFFADSEENDQSPEITKEMHLEEKPNPDLISQLQILLEKGVIEYTWGSLRLDKNTGVCSLVQHSDDSKTECSILIGRGGPFTRASLEPGGSMSFEYPNILGNASIITSVASSTLFHLQDDSNFNVKCVHPWFGGNTLCGSAYKTVKLHSVLPMGVDQVLDTAGIKANITENFTTQIKFAYGVVLESTAHGKRLPDGTPTTHRDGNQRCYGQLTLAKDSTKFVNGAIVGDKFKFEIDQSPSLCGRFRPFNRHQLSMTKFLQLKEAEEGFGKPSPPVFVFHVHYGGHMGDLFPYDAFTIGGPNSVRAYNVGEVGAGRNILEVAAEVRLPLRNAQLCVFAEHGSDLGSSVGNRTLGHGSSYGFGAKLGWVRAEIAFSLDKHTGTLVFGVGERFLDKF